MPSTKQFVATIGLGSTFGEPLIRDFTSETFRDMYTRPIRALLRAPSKYEWTDEVEYLKGVQVLMSWLIRPFSKVYPKRGPILRRGASDQRFTCTRIQDVAKSVAAIVHRSFNEVTTVVKIPGDTTSFDDVINYFRNAHSDVKLATQQVPLSETVKQPYEPEK
ncbi:hypothetical protein TRICI_006720 [Trichomonascus ciferrii]|uniref:Uncharacterized protein n=1 Tax=Trichomonascus ciferrii TaxID=44093 RepID=A0A642UED2_9ASCO|nr:hypothetical protein TRICI_006720 [Trichomonascus ciferrii]